MARHDAPAAQHAAALGRFAMFSALRYRDYRLYWFGQLSSVVGQNMQFVAQSWLMLDLTNSPAMLGLAGLANAVPNIALTLVGGVVADRTDRRTLLRVTQVLQGLLNGALATLVVTGLVNVGWVFAFAFCTGVLRAFDQPSRAALIPHLVPRDDLTNAVALGGSVWQFSRLVGPALAGGLIASFNVAVAFYVACFGFATLVVLLGFVRGGSDAPERRPGQSFLRDMLGGLHFIVRNEVFSTLIGMTFLNSLFGMSYVVLLPVFARDILQVGAEGYGSMQTVTAAGALGGTLVAAATVRSGRRGVQLLAGAAAFGALIVVFSLSTWFALSLALLLLMGLTNQLYMTTVSTVLQSHLPNELRGRVMGIYGLAFSIVPLGGAIAGAVAEHWGAPLAVGLGGACVAGMALAAALLLPRVRAIA